MFKAIKNFFIEALFPARCIHCGSYEDWLCSACYKKIKLSEKTATEYKLDRGLIEDIFIAGNYDNDKILSTAIKNFKYRGLKELSEPLGRFLSFFWNSKLASLNLFDKKTRAELENALLIPIPLSNKRLQERGFNQAEMLAEYLSREFSYEILKILKRKKGGRHQAFLDNKKREKNIEGVFYIQKDDVEKLRLLKNQSVIIIDDVVTSGATLREAAKVLKNTGFGKIYALVLAKG